MYNPLNHNPHQILANVPLPLPMMAGEFKESMDYISPYVRLEDLAIAALSSVWKYPHAGFFTIPATEWAVKLTTGRYGIEVSKLEAGIQHKLQMGQQPLQNDIAALEFCQGAMDKPLLTDMTLHVIQILADMYDSSNSVNGYISTIVGVNNQVTVLGATVQPNLVTVQFGYIMEKMEDGNYGIISN